MFVILKKEDGLWRTHSKEKTIEDVRRVIKRDICEIKKVTKEDGAWWISDDPNVQNLPDHKVYFYDNRT